MPKKAPIRTCIACGASSEKRALVRIVRTPDGEVVCDPSGKAAGRGAYICRDAACFAQVRKKRLLGSRLRTNVGAADYERLEEDFAAACASSEQGSRDGE